MSAPTSKFYCKTFIRDGNVDTPRLDSWPVDMRATVRSRCGDIRYSLVIFGCIKIGICTYNHELGAKNQFLLSGVL